MNKEKLEPALAGIIGKAIEGVIIADHPNGFFQVFLTFTDGTHYEFYGDGQINGARKYDQGGISSVRKFIQNPVVDVSGPITSIVIEPDEKTIVQAIHSRWYALSKLTRSILGAMFWAAVTAIFWVLYDMSGQGVYAGVPLFLAFWATAGASWIAIGEIRRNAKGKRFTD